MHKSFDIIEINNVLLQSTHIPIQQILFFLRKNPLIFA